MSVLAPPARVAPARRRELVPPGYRLLGVLVWLVSAAVLGGLAWHLHRTGSGGPVEARIDAGLLHRLREHRRLLDLMVQVGSPTAVVVGSLVLCLLAALLRWWRGALLALVAAPVAGVLTDEVLKPLMRAHNPTGGALAFPSGHSTGAFGLAVVTAVLLVPRRGSRVWPALLRLLLALVALAAAGATAVSVVALGYHHVTDALGGAATATLVVLTLSALVDALPGPRRR